jgi:hypothetical protein
MQGTAPAVPGFSVYGLKGLAALGGGRHEC